METQISPPPLPQTSATSSSSAKRSLENHKSCGLSKSNQVGNVLLYGIPIVSLYIESQERLCLAQISNTLLKQFSYNEIHNRRVALGITCVQCTPVQLEILRRAGAMPVSSRRCGMITRREAERLCKSFLGDNAPPRLPDDFAFSVFHECAWGCRGSFLPSRYNSSRAKCIKCFYCGLFFSPNKFIFHSHRIGPGDKYVQPDAANFNSWRRHMKLFGGPPQDISYAWEDVKAMFNGGTRKRVMSDGSSDGGGGGGGRGTPQQSRATSSVPHSPKRIKLSTSSPASSVGHSHGSSTPHSMQSLSPPYTTTNTVKSMPHMPHSAASLIGNGGVSVTGRLPTDLPIPFSRTFMMDYMWHHQQQQSNAQHGLKAGGAGGMTVPTTSNISGLPTTGSGVTSTPPFPIPSYALPWLKRPSALFFPPGPGSVGPTGSESFIDSKAFSFYNNSAFKPVNGSQLIGSRPQPVMEGKSNYLKEPVSSDEDGEAQEEEMYQSKKHRIELNKGARLDDHVVVVVRDVETVDPVEDEEDDDEILVDIETTEEDEVQVKVSASPQRDLKEECPVSLLQLDPNNNREDPLKRSSRTTPNHMPGKPQAPPLKDDMMHSTTHSKSICSSYSPLSQSSSLFLAQEVSSPTTTTIGGVNSNSSPPTTTTPGNTNCTPNNNELWSVARLTLERSAAVVAAAEHNHHQQQHLNGFYQQQNKNTNNNNKTSSGSSASPVSVSPEIYGHHPHHVPAAVSAIQKPIATFYQHELAKQFQLYRTHHNNHNHNQPQHHHHHHISSSLLHHPGEASPAAAAASPSSQANGVV